MILCLCHAVTDARVRQEIANGALDSAEVGRRCGAGTDCGSCVETIQELISCHQAVARQCARQAAQVEALYALKRAS